MDPTTGIGGKPAPRAVTQAFGHFTEPTCSDDAMTCVAPQLQTSVSELAFPPTRVGERSVATFSITNPAADRSVAIDEADLLEHGLGDFEVHGLNTKLGPGESVMITISYRPTDEGAHRGTVRVFERAGMTTPPVRLDGMAIAELDGQRAERVARLESESKTKRLESFPQERKDAEDAVDRWEKRGTALAHAITNWSSVNWTRFLTETGGDFRVSLTEGHVSNIVGDYVSTVAGLMSQNPVIEFIASAVTSLVYDALLTARGNRQNEKDVHVKIKATGVQLEGRQISFIHAEEAAVARIAAHATTARHRAMTARNEDDVLHVRGWAERETESVTPRPNASDRSLYRTLIQQWVLERSATASSPTEGTNRDAFDAARSTVFGLKPGQDVSRPDLFIFQARHEWSALGIGNLDEIEAGLASRVATLRTEAYAAGLDGEEVASYVKNMLGNSPSFELEIPRVTDTQRGLAGIGIPLPERDYLANRLSCKVSIDGDGSSVIAKHFHYYLGRYVGTHSL